MYNGIINIYKEKGFTSFDVVAKLRGIFHQKKIGHTGTLDPDAEGVLPVCLGNATKVCDLLMDQDKEYETVLLLGRETDTQDVTGEILAESPVTADELQVREVIMSFVGTYAQVPPMYSARKVNGKKLYELARAGITVERQAKEVQIHEITILSMNLPRVRMRVRCSKGTYIRTLCHDIGRRLGCRGCMEELLRTRVGDFRLEDSLKISQVETSFSQENVTEILQSVDGLFKRYPRVSANVNLAKTVINGNKIPLCLLNNDCFTDNNAQIPIRDAKCCEAFQRTEYADGERVRLYLEQEEDAAERFIGIYSFRADTQDLKPVKLFL